MFYLMFLNFVVAFNYLLLHSNDQINPCQVVECKMNKQNHIESFVIEVYVAFESVCEMSIGFSMSVNSTCGSRDDCGKLTDPDYGSFRSPSSAKKADD